MDSFYFCFVEEDRSAVYSDLFARAFVSSCLFAGRRVYTCGTGLGLEHLPLRVEFESQATESDVQIAWRYKSLNPVDNSLTNSKHSFDFAVKLNEQILDEHHIPHHNLQSKNISEIISESAAPSDCIIVIRGIDLIETGLSQCQLLLLMKSLTRRSTSCVVLVTWSPHLVHPKTRRQGHDLADAVFQLQAFAKPSAAYPNFNGLFILHKLAKGNSMNVAKKIETLDLGFQTKKQSRFIEVDKLSLPPDLSENVSRSTCSTAGGGNKKDLNF